MWYLNPNIFVYANSNPIFAVRHLYTSQNGDISHTQGVTAAGSPSAPRGSTGTSEGCTFEERGGGRSPTDGVSMVFYPIHQVFISRILGEMGVLVEGIRIRNMIKYMYFLGDEFIALPCCRTQWRIATNQMTKRTIHGMNRYNFDKCMKLWWNSIPFYRFCWWWNPKITTVAESPNRRHSSHGRPPRHHRIENAGASLIFLTATIRIELCWYVLIQLDYTDYIWLSLTHIHSWISQWLFAGSVGSIHQYQCSLFL